MRPTTSSNAREHALVARLKTEQAARLLDEAYREILTAVPVGHPLIAELHTTALTTKRSLRLVEDALKRIP